MLDNAGNVKVKKITASSGTERAWPKPGEIIVDDESYATLELAIAASIAGGNQDPVYLGRGSYGTSTSGEIEVGDTMIIGAGR